MRSSSGVKVRFQKSRALPGVRVLLVDLDNDTISALTFLLSEIPSGRLEIRASAEEAVRIIPEFLPDLILYAHEPEADGVSFLRQMGEGPQPYVIVLLSEFDPELVKTYTSCGVRDFISRDYKFLSSLRRGVRRALHYLLLKGDPHRDPSSLPGILGSPQVGDQILHYRIEEELGEGGISETYLAQDLNAGHPAVIKILNTCLWKDAHDQQRITGQIKEAAKVHHPNLISIRSVEESGDRTMMVMEYGEGESLKSMMQKGALGIGRVLDIGKQIAEALSAIHEAGLVHGNIRPSSIIVSSYGRARLVDYGFVRKMPDLTVLRIDRRYMERLWRTGILREAASYMSPEQLAGRKIDERSDIFSLGCVLYHAATGVSPFDGISVPLVVHRILRVSPIPPTEIIPHLPEELDQVLALTLAKEREERIRTAKDLSDALGILAAPKGKMTDEVRRARLNALNENIYVQQQLKAKEKRIRNILMSSLSSILILLAVVLYFIAFYDAGTRSLAVLPFQADVPGPFQDAAAMEITENLLQTLSTVPALRTVQAGSVFQLRERKMTIADHAALLNARNVLTGRLMKQKEGWMLVVRLYGSSGRLLKEMYYKTALENSIQSMSEIVPFTLSGIGLAGPAQAFESAKWRSREAYQYYWSGRSIYYRETTYDVERSLEFYEKAIAADSRSSTVYAGMAESFLWLASHSQDPSFWYSRAAEASRMALDLDPRCYQARAVLGTVYLMDDLELRRAEMELRASLDSNPAHVTALTSFAVLLTATGRNQEALQHIRAAGEMDPLSQSTQNLYAWLLVQLRRFDDAILQSRKCMGIGSDSVFVHHVMGDAYLGKGLNEEAQIAYRQTQDLLSPDSAVKVATAMASSRMEPEAKQLLENLEAQSAGELTPEFMAAAYARLGMNDAAFRWLERAFEDRTPGVLMLQACYQFDPLRSDSRMDSLARRIGLE